MFRLIHDIKQLTMGTCQNTLLLIFQTLGSMAIDVLDGIGVIEGQGIRTDAKNSLASFYMLLGEVSGSTTLGAQITVTQICERR
jgi:hypothetical protein